MNTVTVDPSTVAHLARGCYQRALLDGSARWSGADLRGKAQRWSGRYAQSRASLCSRLRAAGYGLVWSCGTAHTGPTRLTITKTFEPVALAYVPEAYSAGLLAA